jgi:glycosyltransferase involved in cell wall biosynthesis
MADKIKLNVLCALPDNLILGGVTQRTVILKESLEKRGVNTLILVPEETHSSIDVAGKLFPEHTVFRYWGRYRLRRRAVLHNLIYLITTPFSILSCWLSIRKSDAEIVHINGLLNLIPGFAARLAGKKVVWHLIGDHYPRWLVKLLTPLIKLLSTKRICVARSMVPFYGGDSSIEVVPEPVPDTRQPGDIRKLRKIILEQAEWTIPQPDTSALDRKWIGGIGNLVPAKDWICFLSVAETLIKKRPDLFFVIVGGESPSQKAYSQSLKKRIEDRNLQNHVWMTGNLPHAGSLAGALDVFLLTSIQEGTPLSIMEAMLAEVPVVATDVGGVAEMLEKNRGVVCPARDVHALVDALENTLNTPTREEQIYTAKQWVEDRRPEPIAELFLNIYFNSR